MSRRRSAVDADLDAVYARIPDAGCKGLCVDACGPIMMTGRERTRIAERGVEVPDGDEGLRRLQETGGSYRCPALDAIGHCTVYDVRPLVCRLYASVPEVSVLSCEHGCRPAVPLTQVQARELVQEVERIAGPPY